MTAENIALLFDWGKPTDAHSFKRDWENYLQYGFSKADEPELIALLIDRKLHEASPESNEIWVPLYAWRILGQLRSVAAIEPLISVLDIVCEDDWAFSELPVVIGMIGELAIVPLCRYLREHEHEHDHWEFTRVMASDSLVEIAKQHPELRDEVIVQLREYLVVANPNDLSSNGLLVSGLINLKAVEAIDEIRSVFQKGHVDLTISGDIEDVEIALGLRHQRETPKPHYEIPGLSGLSRMSGSRGLLDTEGSGGARAALGETYVRDTPKIGRNDPCICGSGKKYKRCCLH